MTLIPVEGRDDVPLDVPFVAIFEVARSSIHSRTREYNLSG